MALNASPVGNMGGYSYLYAITENICIDDTQGFDGIRYYNGYAPTLRSQRSGLKVIEVKQE